MNGIAGDPRFFLLPAPVEVPRRRVDPPGNASLLRVLGAAIPVRFGAAIKAREHERRVVDHLGPADAHLNEEIDAHGNEVDHANAQHLDFELAEVGFEVGIVLASISIIARRRWLLGAAGAAAMAGVALLANGLLFA